MGPTVSIRGAVAPIERETMRRVAWRLLPLLMLGYFSAYMDRVNVGMAALHHEPPPGVLGRGVRIRRRPVLLSATSWPKSRAT